MSGDAPSTAPVAIPAPIAAAAERELMVDVDAEFGRVLYTGTRAQLEDEGLIPRGFKWPQAAAEVSWELDGFVYWLKRRRPEGHKGPMSSWFEVDNWIVGVKVAGRDHAWHVRRRLERKADALRAEFLRCTDAGSRQWRINLNRYLAAHDDKAYQAFKAIFVPQRKKAGRKAKCGNDSISEGAAQ